MNVCVNPVRIKQGKKGTPIVHCPHKIFCVTFIKIRDTSNNQLIQREELYALMGTLG